MEKQVNVVARFQTSLESLMIWMIVVSSLNHSDLYNRNSTSATALNRFNKC
jgi:hypothetical protein